MIIINERNKYEPQLHQRNKMKIVRGTFIKFEMKITNTVLQ